MHALGRYLQQEIDGRGWVIADLIRHSGLSKQTVYNLINDSREYMDQTPQRKTISSLAGALGVDPLEILTISAQALGVPITLEPASASLKHASNDQILQELSVRLSRGEGSNEDQDKPETNPPGKRTLRAVGPRGEVGQGQKIKPEDPEYLKPLPLDQMAAMDNFKLARDKFDDAYGDAGEENQDPDDK
ncbi:helix-turn-helix domain-containing protein [Paeniglutamicibacter sp.]|uniref:helix-turn-helix domain-containing protein n=1 Tax=Paeniglutamicibacter sp. TaxID=1934391 RepID=UPI0039895DAF